MKLKLIKGMRLVVATHNPGKAREIAELLDGRFELVTAASLDLPEPEETETTFAGNALLKARQAAEPGGLIALADDSGLSVSGAGRRAGHIIPRAGPGPTRTSPWPCAKVEERLEETGSDDRRAWFTCALAVAWPDGPAVVVEGRVDGPLTFPPRGDRGFGYDPIFMPEGTARPSARWSPAQKDAISHRARAFAKLKAALF